MGLLCAFTAAEVETRKAQALSKSAKKNEKRKTKKAAAKEADPVQQMAGLRWSAFLLQVLFVRQLASYSEFARPLPLLQGRS